MKRYDDVALNFPTDYDKENPLTSKKGQVRLLEMQIDDARKSGDNNALQMLEKQKAMVEG